MSVDVFLNDNTYFYHRTVFFIFFFNGKPGDISKTDYVIKKTQSSGYNRIVIDASKSFE